MNNTNLLEDMIMGMKSKSGHFGNGSGGPSKRIEMHPKVNLQFFARMPKQRAQIKHIMAERQGHLSNSSKNRKTLEKISRDSKNYIEKKHGNTVYSKIINGNEYWVHVRRGVIQNGGSNGKNYRYHTIEGRKKK